MINLLSHLFMFKIMCSFTSFVALKTTTLTLAPVCALLCVQLKLQLLECQSQLDLARKEAEAHKEELAQVTTPL